MQRLRQTSMVSVWPIVSDGCPTLARFVRKGGIPRTRIPLVFSLISLGLLSGCRLDMHVQPRENPLSRSDFFADQRSARPLVDGTVARGQLHADSYFYTGKIGDTPGDYMPFPATKEIMERGRERFRRRVDAERLELRVAHPCTVRHAAALGRQSRREDDARAPLRGAASAA